MASDARFDMRIPAGLKAKLEREAAKLGLPVAAFVKMVLIERVGWKPPKPRRNRKTR